MTDNEIKIIEDRIKKIIEGLNEFNYSHIKIKRAIEQLEDIALSLQMTRHDRATVILMALHARGGQHDR